MEYESKSESNTESTLSLHYLLLPTPSPLTPSSLLLTPPPYTMSQCGSINYKLLAQQQQEQLITLQMQLQALLAAQEIEEDRREDRGGVSTSV